MTVTSLRNCCDRFVAQETLAVGGFSVTLETMAADRLTGRMWATRSEVLAPNAMAATSQPLATQVALEILRGGGTAVDAAIAANAALGLMEPTGGGIGGDLFALVWEADSQKLHGLIANGASPQSLTREKLLAELQKRGLERIPKFGVLSVSVPGCVDGWSELHGRFGKLPLATILEPAIRYAREAFPVSEVIADGWGRSVPVLRDQPGFLATFTQDGHPPAKGEIWKNPDLAETYDRIARKGRAGFYEGHVAETMDTFMREHGGYLTKEDLAAHRSEWIEPVSTDYRGVTVWELPPPGQGIAALQMLNMLEADDIAGMGFGSEAYLHALIEAKKLAFADRARLYADPRMAEVPVAELISKAYARQRRELIGERAARAVEAGNPALQQGDTFYLTVADAEGNMISLIQSNFRGFGSGVCPTGLGFGLQDRGELFALEADHPNTYAPGKRPFHTIIPAFLTRDGRPWVSFGVMGGDTQPQAHAQIVMNLVDFGMNLQEAGDAPRLVHEGDSEPTGFQMTDGGTVYLESGISAEVIRGLLRRGHRIGHGSGMFGGYQAIAYDATNDCYVGASESRKDGHAAGY